jgi:hypothetical protein
MEFMEEHGPILLQNTNPRVYMLVNPDKIVILIDSIHGKRGTLHLVPLL